MLPHRCRLAEFWAVLELFCLTEIGVFCSACWRYVVSVEKKLSLKSNPSVLLGALGSSD